MNYTIKVNQVKGNEGNVKGFAQMILGDVFKITNIAILENKETGKLFVSMPRYKTNERDDNGNTVYKDVCNPITAECRQEVYSTILNAYQELDSADTTRTVVKGVQEVPAFQVVVTPYEREGSNIRGLARVYFEDSFVINNVNLLQGKEKIFVAMPAFKTGKTSEQGKAIYQDVCYPVTKEFRQKLYDEIEAAYEKAKEKNRSHVKEKAKYEPRQESDRETPFR